MKDSFSLKLKNELVSLDDNNESLYSMLRAMIEINSSIKYLNGAYIEYKTKNKLVANKLKELIKMFYNIEAEIKETKEVRLNKDTIYLVNIYQKVNKILDDFNILSNKQSLKKVLETEEEKIGYLRGAFLSTGSINDPITYTYHLEIQTFKEDVASNLKDIMNSFYLNSKISKNRRGFIVYSKSADKIADFIRILGSSKQLFYFEDLRIERDLSNSINRVMNCEIANQKKTTETAIRQLKEIEFVEKYYQSRLKDTLKEVCILRKKYKEESLLELEEKSVLEFNKRISRSALNHRFREIHEIYKDLKKE